MKFHRIKEPYALECQASENDRWRIAVTPTVMGSMRVNVWHYAEDPGGYCRYYCCGPGLWFTRIVLGAVERYLESLDEAADTQTVVKALPAHTVVDGRALRPIGTDRACFNRLLGLPGLNDRQAELLWEMAVSDERATEAAGMIR